MCKYYESYDMDEPLRDEYFYKEKLRKFDERMRENMNKNKYENNKFYIGSDTIFGRNWGHRTANEAIKHAQTLMDEQGKDEIFIVKIVKVVKRKAAPIEVVDVK